MELTIPRTFFHVRKYFPKTSCGGYIQWLCVYRCVWVCQKLFLSIILKFHGFKCRTFWSFPIFHYVNHAVISIFCSCCFYVFCCSCCFNRILFTKTDGRPDLAHGPWFSKQQLFLFLNSFTET